MASHQILITGGNGGIGLALVQHLLGEPDNVVYASYRQHKPGLTHDRLIWLQADITNVDHVIQLTHQVKAHTDTLSWLVNTVGTLHQHDDMPEKALRQFNPDFFMENIRVNALPTMLLANHFLPLLKGDQRAIFATISAKVGSISDNRLGGWYSYRASKAALNMLLKTLSVEWQRNAKNICVAALHPGTTDTSLSKPFQKNVPAEKLFTPAYTAEKLVQVLNQLSPEKSGQFWSWDGQQLPW